MHEIDELRGEGYELVVRQITHGEGVVRGFGAGEGKGWSSEESV
jgi:hypothetical protein